MQVMAAAGMEYVLLGVDSENPTGAYGVYEDLGFIELRREILVSRTV
jgi:ribosomal protein S18 acetylase RimI-like enzyme